MKPLDLKQLWTKAKSGDRAAWTTLYQHYYQANLAYARQVTGNLEDAEDAVQEAWLDMWEHRERLELLSSALIRLGIFRRAKNIIRNRHPERGNFSYPFQGEDGPIEVPERKPAAEPDSTARAWIEANPRFEERMNAWVTAHGDRMLAPRDREIAGRLWCERPTQSRQEVADRLGMTLEAVEAAVKRICRKRDKTEKSADRKEEPHADP